LPKAKAQIKFVPADGAKAAPPPAAAAANADEIELGEESEIDDNADGAKGPRGPDIEEKTVPDAVFGGLGARARFAQQGRS
jgi:hypothetical protein